MTSGLIDAFWAGGHGRPIVRVSDLGLGPAEIAELTACLRTMHLDRSEPLDQSVRGGTQTDGRLLQRIAPSIRSLYRRIDAEVARYVEALPDPIDGHPLLGRIPFRPRIIGSWSVRLTTGGHHAPHLHPQGWLSSAFYVVVPDVGASSQEGHLTLGEPQPALNTGLAPYLTVEPRPGRLVLFPSTLWHGTRPFARGERMTVAFDVN